MKFKFSLLCIQGTRNSFSCWNILKVGETEFDDKNRLTNVKGLSYGIQTYQHSSLHTRLTYHRRRILLNKLVLTWLFWTRYECSPQYLFLFPGIILQYLFLRFKKKAHPLRLVSSTKFSAILDFPMWSTSCTQRMSHWFRNEQLKFPKFEFRKCSTSRIVDWYFIRPLKPLKTLWYP